MTGGALAGILLVGVLLPREAAAQLHYPPSVYSSSWACHAQCDLPAEYALSEILFPGSATSSISRMYAGMGYNLGGVAESTLVHGEFDAYSYSAAFTDANVGANWVNAKADGQLFDTVVVTGGAGGGQFHLPIHVTGNVLISWSTPALHPYPGASARYGITCAVGEPGTGTYIDCPDPEIVWDQSGAIDQVVELVWGFTAGTLRNFDLRPSLSTEAGSVVGFATGTVTGTAEVTLVRRLPSGVRDPRAGSHDHLGFGLRLPDCARAARRAPRRRRVRGPGRDQPRLPCSSQSAQSGDSTRSFVSS
jgi:hypothetical protein